MGARINGRRLQFPCECVSVKSGYSDPWAAVAQKKLLNDGTKERILNLVAREPRTIAQIAKQLTLSQPAVHAHVTDMVASELLREATGQEKAHPAENYYEPAFPVITALDDAKVAVICRELAYEFAQAFEAKRPELEAALQASGCTTRWRFAEVAQYCYANAQRGARRALEQRGVLAPARRHRNGAEWVFWGVGPTRKNDGR